jgi:hypothetical protein
MAPLDVLPVAAAREYLNIRRTDDDAELAEFIAAAVERVERHIAGDAGVGSTLTTAEDATALQLLAVKAVLADYWATQRVRVSRGTYGGGTAAAVEADTGPDGAASLRARLTELLGPPAGDGGGAPPAPTGSFPPGRLWPDPPRVWGRVWPW